MEERERRGVLECGVVIGPFRDRDGLGVRSDDSVREDGTTTRISLSSDSNKVLLSSFLRPIQHQREYRQSVQLLLRSASSSH